ncbi:MAG: M23 family peptidase [Zetaproteobacteria bacterium]|nr:MAG: M23 family peptidase [Zetaproteobacteria bacterium]
MGSLIAEYIGRLMGRVGMPARAAWYVLLAILSLGGLYQWWHALERSQQLSALQRRMINLQQQSDSEIASLRRALAQERAKAESLAAALGRIEARLSRLDALGARLVKESALNPAEFDFSRRPAMGGRTPRPTRAYPVRDLEQIVHEVERHSARLDADLHVVDYLLEQKQAVELARPHAWPTEGGWLSSPFGLRSDPFTGLPAPHKGVDIANRYGAPVYAAARGVVVFAGKMRDFGYLVDIDHGFGYVTRYGHLSSVRVHPGDLVKTGTVLGTIGSSGRSTGPHLHYEVHLYGQAIDPRGYLPRG